MLLNYGDVSKWNQAPPLIRRPQIIARIRVYPEKPPQARFSDFEFLSSPNILSIMPKHYCLATKPQILTYKQDTSLTNKEITARTGVSQAQINVIAKTARERGWDPKAKSTILDEYVVPKEGSRAQIKITDKKLVAIAASIEIDRYSLEKSTRYLAEEHNLSQASVVTALAKMGYRKTKPTFHLLTPP